MSIQTKTLILTFFIIQVVLAWSDSFEKKDGIKNEKESTEIRRDNIVKKGIISRYGSAEKKWNADASAARITFSVKGIFGMVHGNLTGLKSTIMFDEADLGSSSFSASVDTKSISTGIKLRNSDLQKEKYFNSDKYPSISFRSDKIQASGKAYKAIGGLTIGTLRATEGMTRS